MVELPVLLEPDDVVAAVLPDGFSSLGTSFCMSAWPNSHPGGRLLGRGVTGLQLVKQFKKRRRRG